jgi:adenosylmethionine-8-amino-7-oxononanoate aminotransferase
MGLFWGIELVANKATKAPFAEVGAAERVAGALLARGVAVYFGVGCVSMEDELG